MQRGDAQHVAHSAVSIEPWQLINLIGAPLVALMFVGPVVEDMRGWIASLREQRPSGG